MTTEARPALPYWRLSAFYLCYFAILGAMVPYWTVFLRGRGMSALEIGQLMAVGTLTRILAPWASAWVGDRMPRRIVVVRLAAALMTLIFCGMFVARGFWQVALVTAAFGFFWNAALPQFEIVTLRHLGSTGNLYGRIRLWGSVGFIGVVLGGGWLLERSGLDTLLLVLLATMAGTLISSLLVPDRPGPPAVQAKASLRGALRSPAALGFLAAAFLMQASHGPYYGFFSILLEDQGYTRSMVGALWALGVVAEVGRVPGAGPIAAAYRRLARIHGQSAAGGRALAADRSRGGESGLAAAGADTARGHLRCLSCGGPGAGAAVFSGRPAGARTGALQRPVHGRRRGAGRRGERFFVGFGRRDAGI